MTSYDPWSEVQTPFLVHKALNDPASALLSHLISFHFPLCSLMLSHKHKLAQASVSVYFLVSLTEISY